MNAGQSTTTRGTMGRMTTRVVATAVTLTVLTMGLVTASEARPARPGGCEKISKSETVQRHTDYKRYAKRERTVVRKVEDCGNHTRVTVRRYDWRLVPWVSDGPR